MYWRKAAVFFVATIFAGNVAVADEGVVVDLSVLNSLNYGTSYVDPEPLFPVLPKKQSSSINKKTIAPAKTSSNATDVKVKRPIKNKKSKQNKIIEIKPEEDVVVVDVEPVSYPQEDSHKVSATADTPLPEEKTVQEQKPILIIENNVPSVANETPNIVNDIADNIAPNDIAEERPEPGNLPLLVPVNNSKDEVKPESTSPSLLVDNTAQNDELQNINFLKFADEEDELSPDNQEKIDEIIKKFKNEKNSKIAIYAYNLDNGEDSFRRKRMSLNRAIEVRSYLLRKGFKNFSIKVVNISENSGKVNTVEVEEI